MAETGYAILQEIDKCTRCRACTVACERVQGLTQPVGNAETIQSDDPVVVKAQRSNESPPFVRYSCWHCSGTPACTYACPLVAIKKDMGTGTTNTGAVYVDQSKCNPNDSKCVAAGRPCATKCWRGGYPKVGTNAPGTFAYKCNLCKDRIPGLKPACVETCPAGALSFGTASAMETTAKTYKYYMGDGHIFWASKNPFTAPATDPFIEDHISPMFERILRSPAAKLVAGPALLLGGLYTLYRRRMELRTEPKKA